MLFEKYFSVNNKQKCFISLTNGSFQGRGQTAIHCSYLKQQKNDTDFSSTTIKPVFILTWIGMIKVHSLVLGNVKRTNEEKKPTGAASEQSCQI